MSDDTPPLATIKGQTPTVGLTDSGQAVNGYRVEFQTAKGVTGHVFVPIAQFTEQAVMQAVRDQAMKLDALQGQKIY